jgi:serine/threonine protein kinase
MPLTSGTKLGPYEIQSLLGAGGMGEVYRARDTRLQRDVAIKILPSSLATDQDRLRRFEQEARAVAALNHPNLLTVFDVGTAPAEQQGSDATAATQLAGSPTSSPNSSKARPSASAFPPALSANAAPPTMPSRSLTASPPPTSAASSIAT